MVLRQRLLVSAIAMGLAAAQPASAAPWVRGYVVGAYEYAFRYGGRPDFSRGGEIEPRAPMPDLIIRPARAEEYDEIGRVWMESWVSTGLGEASDFLLANLRARIRREIADGWSLFVADDRCTIAAMPPPVAL